MKQIYRLAQKSFEATDGPTPRDKVFHMGYIDGFLDGFRKARDMSADICDIYSHEAKGKSKATLTIKGLGES